MSTGLEAVLTAKRTGDWNGLLSRIPMLEFLGVRWEVGSGGIVGRMPFADHLVGNPTLPAIHGGSLGTLLEAAAQVELLFRAETVVLPKTITFTVDYLRSARPVDTYVRAVVRKHGRRVATVHSVAWQEDEERPVATANAQLLILGAEP